MLTGHHHAFQVASELMINHNIGAFCFYSIAFSNSFCRELLGSQYRNSVMPHCLVAGPHLGCSGQPDAEECFAGRCQMYI